MIHIKKKNDPHQKHNFVFKVNWLMTNWENYYSHHT